MRKKQNLAYSSLIYETFGPVTPFNVISEGTDINGRPKVVFKAKLQTANERNGNGRIYSTAVCRSIVDQLSKKANQRSLLMEVD